MVFKINLLDRRIHDYSCFSCGELSLDTYLKKQASQDLKKRVTTVFVLVDHPAVKVLGYYTLSAYTVNVSALSEDFSKRLPRYPLLPATLLGRLAVDQICKGKGFGEMLLIDALLRAQVASQQVASLAVIVEALTEQAQSFYAKYGFVSFKQEPRKLYLPMKLIESLF